MEPEIVSAYNEATLPLSLIWERINHAYSSDSPPTNWGLQKGTCGFQSWFFCSHNEKYTVVWDNNRSYWKVNTPFESLLFFIGPLFINHSRDGLHVPPIFNVTQSEKDILKPASAPRVAEKMVEIVRYIHKPTIPTFAKSSTTQQ